MKKTPQEMIETINCKLYEHNQMARVVEWGSKHIVLDNGIRLENNKRLRFIRRILNSPTTFWVENIDNLLSGKITESQIRSKTSTNGGIIVHKLHGDKLRQSLRGRKAWNKGLKGLPGRPLTAEAKLKISIANSGDKNGMYGVKKTDEQKKEQSEMMKQLILSGEFTPNTNNRNTHWDAQFDGKQYRSSWEALYQYMNPVAKYETFRIIYELYDNTHVYIVDFIDEVNRIVVEVKPKEMCSGDKFDAKMKALYNWANNNEYSVLLVDRKWLRDQSIQIDYSRFDNKTAEKIRKIYEVDKPN